MRIYSLDILRAFAILSVLLVHTLDFAKNLPYEVKYLLSYGWIGVDLFFVLSGFLIGFQVKKEMSYFNFKSIYHFWIKRWTRTLPLYYVVFLVYYLIKPFFLAEKSMQNQVPFLFLIQNFFEPKDFVQSWSLCIEEQFYLLFPIVIICLKKIKVSYWYWLLPACFSLTLRAIFYSQGLDASTPQSSAFNYQFPTWTHLDGISFGLFLAFSYDRWIKIKKKTLILWPGILLLILTLCYIEPMNLNEKIIPSYFLLSASFSLILIGIYDYEPKKRNSFIINSALWSYSIYLWNNLIAKVILKLALDSFLINLILFFLLTYLISYLSFHFIEVKGIELRKKLLK